MSDNDKLQQLLNWLNEFDNSNFKPTYVNMREKVWHLMSEPKCKHLKTYQKIRFGKTLTKCSDCRIILSIGSTVINQNSANTNNS